MKYILPPIVLFVCLAAAVVAADAARFLGNPLANDTDTTVVIEPGMSFGAIAELLVDKDVIANERYKIYFSLYARYQGAAQEIKSGEYRVPSGQTPHQLLKLLTSGNTVRYRITLVEGWTFAEMRQAIATRDALQHTLKGKSAAQIMAALGHPDQKAEGLFMPDTYFFSRGATDLSIYRRAYDAMHKFLQKAWSKRAEDIAVDTPYEALILASIIQKEAAVAGERKRISGVFTRRLKDGMLLQTDASVIYGIEDFQGNITSKDLRTDTPYNTYMNPGLPPTPIALPSRGAIVAALHPADGDALYFVAKGDGSGTHIFSETLAEHRRAVRKYQLN